MKPATEIMVYEKNGATAPYNAELFAKGGWKRLEETAAPESVSTDAGEKTVVEVDAAAAVEESPKKAKRAKKKE